MHRILLLVLLAAAVVASPVSGREPPAVALKAVKPVFNAKDPVVLELEAKKPVWAENLHGRPPYLIVERFADGTWVRVSPIVLGGPPSVQVPVGLSKVELNLALEPGTYRATLKYRGTQDVRRPATTVSSRRFQVR